MAPTPGLALSGLRVLDLTGAEGAYGARLLADLGADVVKVEAPAGDPDRRLPLSFAYRHANKRGVCLDVGSPASEPRLRELGVSADVVLLAPSLLRPVAGFDPETGQLGWARDDAIVCVISPFGLTGPYRDWRATHLTSYAMSGLMYTKGAEGGQPQVVPGQQMYVNTGVYAAGAVLAALRDRPFRGGRTVDLSVHEVLTHSVFELFQYTSRAEVSQRGGRAPGGFIGVWECADGPVELAVSSDKQWRALVTLLGSPPELDEPTWDHPVIRQQHAAEIRAALVPAIARMPREAFVSGGQELGVPCGLVNTVSQFVADPQPRSRGYFVPAELAEGVELEAPGAPFVTEPPLFDQYHTPAPRLGQEAVAELLDSWATPAAPPTAEAPMSGIRVLSFGTAIVGAMSGTVLAELGADVVKIESPGRPDNLRGLWGPGEVPVHEPSGSDVCPMFAGCNRSVRSLSLDMKDPESAELFLDLVGVADVVVENYGPGTMERWGLGWERLSAANPRLVLLSYTGFGQTDGPRSHFRAYGSTAWSFVGMETACGYSNGTHYDYMSQGHGVLGVLAALANRDRTGRGAHLDLALVEVGGIGAAALVLDAVAQGAEPTYAEHLVPGALLHDVVPCRGFDRWLAYELHDDQEAAVLASVVGFPAPGQDAAALEELRVAVRDWARELTPDQGMRILQGVGLAAGAVQDTEDVYRDVQHRARGFLQEMNHPDLGRLEFAATPHGSRRGPHELPGRTPRLGEHTVEVLTGWLGLSEDEARRFSWPDRER